MQFDARQPAGGNIATPRLVGAPNFRDLGGYAAHDGRRLRHRRIYRSDALTRLTPGDRQILDSLPIGVLCDVRSARERAACPNSWPSGYQIECLHVDVSNDMRAANTTLMRVLMENCTERDAYEVMLATYRSMPRAFVGRLAHIVDRLLASPEQAMLIHCTAGKDRTGFLCAMLMLALGVDRDTVFEEYMLTAARCDVHGLAAASADALAAAIGRETSPEFNLTLAGVSEEYLQLALDTVDLEFGSIDGYLQTAGGLDHRRRAQLQDVLLE
jgi:protein-tyrosine phosphatase